MGAAVTARSYPDRPAACNRPDRTADPHSQFGGQLDPHLPAQAIIIEPADRPAARREMVGSLRIVRQAGFCREPHPRADNRPGTDRRILADRGPFEQ